MIRSFHRYISASCPNGGHLYFSGLLTETFFPGQVYLIHSGTAIVLQGVSQFCGTGPVVGDRWLKVLSEKHFQDLKANCP